VITLLDDQKPGAPRGAITGIAGRSGTRCGCCRAGERAVIYCFLFLFVSAHGAGNWSVDAVRG